MSEKSPLVATVVVTEDPGAADRGFSMVGREFYLRYPYPIEDEGVHTDGTKVKANYYVVSLKEFMRVCPEAANLNYKYTEDIYIPTIYGEMSFKPSYVK